ncbi:MAG: serine/threonine-protein kinase, partial [Candidatus Krumholzibacteriia bacterium]
MSDQKPDPHLPDRPDPDAAAPAKARDDDATLTMGGASATSAHEQPGARIGNYKLLGILGEGGFGTVYRAEQLEPVKRRVALKIIKLGMDTRQVIARFDAEKQALAMMDHPGIAKVFDAGSTGTGRPYFVMELVEGVPVTRYCDHHRLGTRERLELFSMICAAVQHAHQKGVIHRDIKPSNVLVTEVGGRPVPKVIDFGIAKATEARLTEQTLFTHEAHFIGTPAYMSPEQTGRSDLDVDTRSDIYSLGVLLYELLAGVTPFDGAELRSAGFAEIQRIIREDDPPRPSARASRLGERLTATAEFRRLRGPQLVKRLQGELDWIVMKCLEKDRTRRYETADGLALDVSRFLANEPVAASPPSRSYRLRKLVVRNRAVFAAGTAMVLLLAAGVLGTGVGLVRARAAERAAVSEAAKSAQVARFLSDMLGGVGPSAARGRDTEMLEEILAATDAKIGEELADQPEVEGEIRSHLGMTYYDLGPPLHSPTVLVWHSQFRLFAGPYQLPEYGRWLVKRLARLAHTQVFIGCSQGVVLRPL